MHMEDTRSSDPFIPTCVDPKEYVRERERELFVSEKACSREGIWKVVDVHVLIFSFCIEINNSGCNVHQVEWKELK